MRRSYASSDSSIQRHVRRNMMTFDPYEADAATLRQYEDSLPSQLTRPLDKIPKEIVGKAAMPVILRRAAEVGAAWSTKLMSYYKTGFPRQDTKQLSKDVMKSVAAYDAPRRMRSSGALITVKELVEANVLREVPGKKLRGWTTVFQVPKNEEVDRAIINCKEVNKGFGKPPPLSLAEIGTLLGLISFFPDAVLSTADIRHFFWQLRLAKSDSHWFSMFAEGFDNPLQCVALPMGWSWSPWVAQGVAGLAVVEAAAVISIRFKREVKAVPGGQVSDDSPPPYWYIVDGDEVVAIVVIWYDNFLVAAARSAEGATDWNQAVRLALDQAMTNFNIKWKRDVDKKAWTVRDNDAEYIGLHFYRINGDFAWKHIDSNIDAWRSNTAAITPTMTLVDLSHLIGVVSWDAHARLGKRMPLEVRHLMSMLGTEYHEAQTSGASKRSRDEKTVTLEHHQLKRLKEVWHELLENSPCTAPALLLTEVRLLASDATPKKAAGVILDRRPTPEADIHDVRAYVMTETHINCIETVAAVRTVLTELRRTDARNTLFAIAVDNTTAVAWFNGRTALDERVQRELESMDAELSARNCRAWAWWEPTATQPADEPSREERKPIDELKVASCGARLLESALTSLTQLTLPRFKVKTVVGDAASV